MAGLRTEPIACEADLAAAALALGAESTGGLSNAEREFVGRTVRIAPAVVRDLRRQILAGDDPLGECYCRLRSAATRRQHGAVYTPPGIVESMVDWSASIDQPARVIEPGAGSGRFLLAAGRRFPEASLVAVETDPLAALICRANLAATGLAQRADVRLEDFRTAGFDHIDGRTLYLGNPPYVRHHQIDAAWKCWFKKESAGLGCQASALAGLHVHFFLAIALRARRGDYGALITAAEWLDVNYGRLLRELFLGRLGGRSVTMIAPRAAPFPGTQTTAAVTTFVVGDPPRSARFARIEKPHELNGRSLGRKVTRTEMAAASRWSHLIRKPRRMPRGFIELGELCRVHRGQATGANRIWIAGDHSAGLPDDVLEPAVTRARELIGSADVLSSTRGLRRVIDLPADVSGFPDVDRAAIERFLRRAARMGACDSYIARHRDPWWSVGLRAPAPILATYMARRPPAFVLNLAKVRHLNIAHGLYPRQPLSEATLRSLVRHLCASATMQGGRVYAGGLTKFEPREMERIPVPRLEMLDAK